MTIKHRNLYLPDVVGKGYGTFWRFKGRYRVCKGSRASKKSKTTALNNITRLMEYPQAIRADSAEPKSIDRLYTLGLSHIRRARKGKDSINNGIDFIQDYKIFIHPKCVNFLTEIGNYTWDTDTKTGKKLNRPIDDFNHLMDAMRYALEEYSTGPNYSFK